MANYQTVMGQNTAEYTEKHSRFIATLRHCETEKEALDFIDEMRSKYWDARHNVFAYSVECGSLKRFSDDGEPHGTAGKPVLDIIDGSNITNAAVVVTRYFGGILLGTGGLVRAYSKSARDAIASSEIVLMVSCTLFETSCDYTDHGKLVNLISQSGGTITDTDFGANVKLSYYFQNEYCKDFLKRLSEAFSARLKAAEIEEKVFPIKI